MKNTQKGFCMFFDWVEDLDQLGDSDGAWQIVKALSEYFKNGKNPVEAVDGSLKVIASIMFHQIKRAEDISQKRSWASYNGKKRIDNLKQSNAFCCATETETKTITETILFPDTITKDYNISIPESEYAPERENENVETNLQTFGKFANVRITSEQYEDLHTRYGDVAADELIERFSAKLKAKTYHYDDHYAALQLWAIQDGLKPVTKTATSFDVDEFYLSALSATQTTLNETR